MAVQVSYRENYFNQLFSVNLFVRQHHLKELPHGMVWDGSNASNHTR